MDGTLDFSTINEDQIKICFDLVNINHKNGCLGKINSNLFKKSRF